MLSVSTSFSSAPSTGIFQAFLVLLGELSADLLAYGSGLGEWRDVGLGGFGGGSGLSNSKERRGLIGGALRSFGDFDAKSEASETDLDKEPALSMFEREGFVRGRGVGRNGFCEVDAIPSNFRDVT